MEIKPVTFYSGECLLQGDLYLSPESSNEKAAGIILCQGFAGTKDMFLPDYAKKFAENGYIVLTFDYRGFGKSEGEAGRLVPKMQVEDIKNALSFLEAYDAIDPARIGIWGTSYGGANAIMVAADDKRIKCLVVQVTFGDGERVITSNMSLEEIIKFKNTLKKMEEKKRLTGKEMMVPVTKILSDEQSKQFFKEHAEEFPGFNVKIPFLTILETINYKPEQQLQNVNIPILIVGAENDLVNPVKESSYLYEKAKEPKELMIIKDATHFDIYSGDSFIHAVNKQISWFDKCL